MTVTVSMLLRVGIETNLEKTKSLVCTPGYIWGKWSKAVYKHRANEAGATFRDRKRDRVSCSACGVTVVALYLKGHIERQNVRSVP